MLIIFLFVRYHLVPEQIMFGRHGKEYQGLLSLNQKKIFKMYGKSFAHY